MLYLSDLNSRNKSLFIYTKKRSIFVERFLFCEVSYFVQSTIFPATAAWATINGLINTVRPVGLP